MAQNTRLTAVGEEFTTDNQPALQVGASAGSADEPVRRGRGESVLMSLLLMTLRTLPAKTIVALAAIADLAMIASVFVLVLLVISSATPLQLIGVAGYAVFVLIALGVRRRS